MFKRHAYAFMSLLILLLLIQTMEIITIPAKAASKSIVVRLWGGDRYQTACSISREGWQSANNVILTCGEGDDNFTDAIAGTTLSYLLDAPILFTNSQILNSDTVKELTRLGAGTVYVLGGENLISNNIISELTQMGKTVFRLSGENRYNTAIKIASQIMTIKPSSRVVITSGEQFQYSMMAAPFAAKEGWPILFTKAGKLDPLTKDALGALQVKSAVIIGSSSIVPDETINLLKEMGISTERISGNNMQEINISIIKKYASSVTSIAIARDDLYVDALAGCPFAAKKNIPIILTGKDSPAPEIISYVKGLDTSTDYVFGSPAVMSQDIVELLFPNLYSSGIEKLGNTPGNIVNGGIVAEQGDFIYVRHINDDSKLYRSGVDGNNLIEISDNKAKGINILGEWIYYINENDKNRLYKMRIDGKDNQQICDDSLSSLCVTNDWIYYINLSDDKNIYKIQADGSFRMKLNNDSSYFLSINNGWIYYCNLDDGSKIYSMKEDGGKRSKLCDDKASYAVILGSWVYYCNGDDGNKIYRIRTDGKDKVKLNNDASFSLNINNGWIYYVNGNKGSSVYKMKMDGTDKRFLNFHISNSLNIANGWIYYYNEDVSEFYKMKLDGTLNQPLYSKTPTPLMIPIL